MLILIGFIITTLALGGALMLFPKNVEKQNFVSWLIVTIMLIITIWSFGAGILSLLGIPVTLSGFIALNIIVTVMLLAVIAYKKKMQKYVVRWQDVLMMAVLLLITVVVALNRYGSDFSLFAYDSDDAVRHYGRVKSFVLNGILPDDRYVMYLLDGIFVMCIEPFCEMFYWYKGFIAADLVLFFLMGAMFWVTITKRISGKFSYVYAMFLSLAYLFGFPFTNLLHGFEYLGMGVLMINFVIWIFDEINYDKLTTYFSVILVMLVNLSVCMSYTLFAPAVYIGELIFYYFYFRKKRNIVSWQAFVTMAVGFAVPGVMCVWVVAGFLVEQLLGHIALFLLVFAAVIALIAGILFVIAKKYKTTVKALFVCVGDFLERKKKLRIFLTLVVVLIAAVIGYKVVYQGLLMKYLARGVLKLDGSIYRNPYGDFILWMFPAAIFIVKYLKEKKNDILMWLFAGFMVYAAWLVKYILYGVVGSYYFYKMHFVLWLIVLIMSYKGVTMLKGEALKNVKIYLGVVVILFVVFVSGAEKKFNETNYFLWPETVLDNFFGIYEYNAGLWENGGNLNMEMMELYEEAFELYGQKGSYMPIFGNDVKYTKDYYYVMSNQDRYYHSEVMDIIDRSDNPVGTLAELGIEYVMVVKPYDEGRFEEDFKNFYVFFENNYGQILKVEYNNQ